MGSHKMLKNFELTIEPSNTHLVFKAERLSVSLELESVYSEVSGEIE
jgi:hypothetical protein